jgi:hypothetical protein
MHSHFRILFSLQQLQHEKCTNIIPSQPHMSVLKFEREDGMIARVHHAKFNFIEGVLLLTVK